jgi:hypothetical protein
MQWWQLAWRRAMEAACSEGVLNGNVLRRQLDGQLAAAATRMAARRGRSSKGGVKWRQLERQREVAAACNGRSLKGRLRAVAAA